MIGFIVYLFGVGVMISGLYFSHKDEDVTIGKAISMVFLTLFSWVSLVVLVILYLIDHFDFNKVIYHGKKNKGGMNMKRYYHNMAKTGIVIGLLSLPVACMTNRFGLGQIPQLLGGIMAIGGALMAIVFEYKYVLFDNK